MARGTDREVTIAGRTFTLGAVYARRPSPGLPGPRPPRRLLAYTDNSLLPGGRVTVAPASSGVRRVMAGTEWAAWAGESVGANPEDVGR